MFAITWLADADHFQTSSADSDGLADFGTLKGWVNNLVIGGNSNWRLPKTEPINGVDWVLTVGVDTYDGSSGYGYNIADTRSERGYMFYVNLGNPSRYTTAGALSGCFEQGVSDCLDNVDPFINLTPDAYWSQTIYNGLSPFRFATNTGSQALPGAAQLYRGGAVHDGDIGEETVPVPEPGTFVMPLAGLAITGAANRRR